MMLLAALLAWAPPVQRPHDEPPILALSWTTGGASACPARAAVIERIAEQGVGGRIGEWVPERHGDAALAVEVEVTIAGERWRADLRLRDADGESTRSFSAASCEALADATALIVAVTLDPIAVASMQAGAAADVEPELPEPEPAPPRPEPDARVDPPRDPPIDLTLEPGEGTPPPQRWPEDLQVGLSIHGGGGWGPFNAGSGLVGGRLALLGPRWRAELGGRYAIPRRLERDGGAGVFDAWAVEGRGCFAPDVGRLEFPLCPGVELGSVRGRGVAPTLGPDERSFLWAAASLSQGLSFAPVDRFAIGVELGLVVPLTRGDFIVGETTIASLALVGGRAIAVLELRLP